MMKKLLINIFFIVSIICIPSIEGKAVTQIKSNETLGGLKQTLKELQNKQAAQNNKKRQTQSEINSNLQKKDNAEKELMQTKEEIESTEKKIERTNEEIEKLKKEIENLMILYQKLENENVYISYVTGASTITELIMRLDAINQLTEYNKQKLSEMETLIKSNEKMNKELEQYQVKLSSKIVAYENSVDILRDELAEIELGTVTIQDEIKNLQALIKNYESLGCKDTQLLTACVDVSNNTGWLKPVSKGRINSLYGYRKAPTAGASSYHKGIDIGVSEKTRVYSTANGVVGAIVERSSCGGNMVYVWVTVQGKPYTIVFMHLYSISVKVGQKVYTNTEIGLSGGGSTATRNGGYDRCTTGAHLHYGVASGGFYGSSKSTPLSSFNSHTMNPPGYPGLYQWFYSR